MDQGRPTLVTTKSTIRNDVDEDWLLVIESPSTILEPCFSTSSYISCCPPETPCQLTKMISGSPSWLKSNMAWAVLWAELGYHTWPASMTRSKDAGLAGSVECAGMTRSIIRVSTAITSTGIPPNLARPTTTVRAYSPRVSWKEPLSKNPERCCVVCLSVLPSSNQRGL